MHRPFYSFLFLCCFIQCVFGTQEPDLFANAIPKFQDDSIAVDSEAIKITPIGYFLIESNAGDIDSDGREDKILTVQSGKGESEKRMIILFLRQSDGKLKWTLTSNKAILCSTCGGSCCGDPYQTTTISENGNFTTEHYGGSNQRWNIKTTYRFLPEEKNWVVSEIFIRYYSVMEAESNYREVVQTPDDFGKIYFVDYVPTAR